MESYKKSYQHQIDHLKHYPEERCRMMLDHSTINRWRHERMYKFIDPLLQLFPKSEWLTVGDFYYGSDAQYIHSKGHNVVASDINDNFLKKGKEKGYIENYSEENLESLRFNDCSFDFVLCKETLHHLPRPYAGLYEMLRVSKVGVLLIEPFDRFINASLFEKISNWLLKKLKGKMHDMYEPSGNYKYPISTREIEKIALGMNLP
ncbi:MAG: class I SAM-dependent methyltransferase, partial [Ignavibacteriaceae bacterium]